MRNLVVLDERVATLPGGDWVATSADAAEERLFALSSTGLLACVVDSDVVWEVSLPPASDWHWCTYHQELEVVVCASRSGCLLAVHVRDQDIDVIGHFDDGLCGVAWSGSEDQVALVTGNGNFVTMSASWDVLSECPLEVSAFGGEATLVSIAWRADGKFLAMNGVFAAPTRQVLIWEHDNATWKRHGVGRHEDSRALMDLGSALAWAPNHTLVASTQMLKKQHHVVFFERNGLRHGEFAVDAAIVSHVQWNSLSDVVAVAVVTASGVPAVQLWTRSNYHWYLKREHVVADNVSDLRWDLETPHLLHVLLRSGTYHAVTFHSRVHASATPMATVAVIDGCDLKLTHFGRAMIPPPMSAQTVRLPAPVNALAFADDSIVLSTSCGAWYLVTNGVATTVSRAGVDYKQPMQSLAYDGHSVWGVPEGGRGSLIVVALDLAGGVVSDVTTVAAPMEASWAVPSMDGQAVQIATGERFHVASGDTDDTLHPRYAQWTLLDNDVCLGWVGSKLFVNGAPLASAIASFHVSHGYLMITTLGAHPTLQLYKLSDLAEDATLPVHSQPVERGARLVTAVPHKADVVLQMPRGNLEVVVPRPLLLTLVQAYVADSHYAPALELCRKHRVDMNVLVDIDAAAFVAAVPSLIETLPSRVRNDRLSLFLTNLHPINVCSAKYALPSVAMPQTWDKVRKVCAAFRAALLARDTAVYLLPLLTCEAKMLLLEPALRRLQLLQREDAALAQKGLQHLVFLVDVDVLYDEALGLYDMELTRLVAGFTQRDPKEYLPELAAYEALATAESPAVMRYTIDVALRRFAKALSHLATEPLETARALALITTHHLYEDGLRLFPPTSPLHREIVLAHAAHLVATGAVAAGGAAYLAARPPALDAALDAFRKALDWRMAVSIAARLPDYDVATLAYEMAEELLNAMGTQRNPTAAAELYIHYCHDVDEGVATLVQAREWQRALQAALLHGRSDLVETEVEPQVVQAAEDLLDDLATRTSTYTAHWTRLTTLREQVRLFRLHGIDGRGDDTGMDDGASSAASAFSNLSMSSVGSHNSNRDVRFGTFTSLETASHSATTSPFYAAMTAAAADPGSTLKKKMPRRFRRTKIQEGSADEDAYVDKWLHAVIPTTEFAADTKRLLEMLVYFGQTRTAQRIQVALDTFLDHIDAHPPPGPAHGDGSPEEVVRIADDTWKIISPLV
ncbi:RNA polymerase II elongator complex subunit [Achlya hypogyna]|uniref:Elongator complex protein 1 n=1 Tax=Achlya hypogyna TaxID=1202772 RepID=A0A1V9ZUR9_ACHHY|nr:RNA polymerase II elongator complex subunit [Achlya hypogyna]